MDNVLIEYLRSDEAWVLIGSGPSSAMGYPTWQQLAEVAAQTATEQIGGHGVRDLNSALKRRDFPMVFEETKKVLGGARLLQVLRDNLKPATSNNNEIYRLIAKWPVPVYLTTNYDDELQKHLTNIGEAYIPYSNSEDHLSNLVSGFSGAIVKLHGDLRSEIGLILTSGHYHDIVVDKKWEYWRVKMTAVFQMSRMVIVGHSLTDENIRHILEIAKKGSSVIRPVCWIAPDVAPSKIKEFLVNYRIRVVSYDNSDGQHANLFRLLQSVSDFVPSRTKIRMKKQIADAIESPLGVNSAAPGFYVFNKMLKYADYDKKRIEIMLAAIKSALPLYYKKEKFTVAEVLESAGWPKNHEMNPEIEAAITSHAVEEQLLVPSEGKFKVGAKAASLLSDNKKQFEHLRDRFKQAVRLRLKREYTTITDDDVEIIVTDIEKSLTGYFREGGLSLATTLLSNDTTVAPASIVKFINEASCRYDDYQKRQAFFKVSVDVFVHAETAEREYLGRIAQGFFAFHALGTFGDISLERIKHAKDTVWLLDSNVQIPLLALAAPSNMAFVGAIARLKSLGVRFFSTESLFEETREHQWFANKIIDDFGSSSPEVIAAATGEPPFRKSNVFLEGFIKWRSAGNPADWDSYLYAITGQLKPNIQDIKNALSKLGVETIDIQTWPGFKMEDFVDRDTYVEQVRELREQYVKGHKKEYTDEELIHATKKAQPEGEAFLVIKNERAGKFNMLSEPSVKSPSWFISQTALLNTIESGSRVTWQPEAFLDFASTIVPPSATDAANQAFESILWGIAQSGISLITENEIKSTFGNAIDQASIKLEEQRQLYETTLEKKYGEPLDAVLKRVSPSHQLMAIIQLSNEIVQAETDKRVKAEGRAAAESKRADSAEKLLEKVSFYRKKMETKQKGKSVKSRSRGKKKKK